MLKGTIMVPRRIPMMQEDIIRNEIWRCKINIYKGQMAHTRRKIECHHQQGARVDGIEKAHGMAIVKRVVSAIDQGRGTIGQGVEACEFVRSAVNL
jgi:hypothetical protein